MNVPNHFSSVMLSNWQSAVAKVATSPARTADGNHFLNALERLPLQFHDALVSAGAYAAHAFEEGINGRTPALPPSGIESCAKAALNLAIAKFQHDDEAVAATQQQLARYGTCDPRWAECITEFVSHYALTKHGNVPYRRWQRPDDFVITDQLPAKCRIGILGDWGTGDLRAQAVLEQLATHQIDIFIHLGDIYYSCTTSEANLFYDSVRNVFDRNSKVKIYTLCGNHDMYSGGAPYYALLDRLQQPASFFCLRNEAWQIIAGDTGYNDFDPFTHGGIGSWLQDLDDRTSPYSELLWHLDKFRTANGRRTMFLTHHQPFSRNAAIDGSHATNRRLLTQLGPVLDQIDLWLWGHEHNQVIYTPAQYGVRRGRCVGASAIPVPGSIDLYTSDPNITEPTPEIQTCPLTLDSQRSIYNLGFAVIELNGRQATERYFEYDTSARVERELYYAEV